MSAIKISKEAQEESLRVAKANQKPGQTKDQTKLIAQGIEKGIAEYKKQQSKKNREKDKARKQAIKKSKQIACESDRDTEQQITLSNDNKLPWLLLIISWVGFIIYLLF